ncbi:AMP-binding protein, partial [Paraburkholderia sp. SIMBA_049]
ERLVDVGAVALITADEQARGGKTLPLKSIADEAIAMGGCEAVKSVIVYRRTGGKVDWHAGRDLWMHELADAESDTCAPEWVGAEHPLFILYTSGSTGTPKAVVVEHGPLAAHCDALAAALPIEGGDRLLHFASVNFDAAHECWLAPLAVGASVTIAPPQPFAPDAAHALMVRESVSVAAFPP